MADKLKMQTENLADKNFELLSKMFPNALTETITGYDDDGKPIVERAIDADVLRQEISCKVVEGKDERYQFTWPDKKKAVLLANTPIDKTLRPCREESVDFDNTENLYIEGDNLEVLKLLHETYLGKVKMIYIDPPYNTGNDFVYEDDFTQSMDEYRENSGQLDDDGNRLVKNMDSNGRFHTDWLNMIYPRIKLAKDLLTDDGVIFISIDDNEQENLKKCCDEILGQDNFLMQIAWRRTDNQPNIGTMARVKEYILVFAKNKRNVRMGRLPLSEKAINEYRYEDEQGKFRRGILLDKTRGRRTYSKTTKLGNVLTGPWMVTEEEFDRMEANGLIYWTESGDGQPYSKIYLKESKGAIPNDFWGIEFGTNQRASLEVEKLFGKRYFDFPKAVSLISTIVKLGAPDKDDIILDFFSGSSTTAQAIMQINQDNCANRKYIMIQIPEKIDQSTQAYRDGYKTICGIGKERIRRAAKKIAEENPEAKFDGGFRVLKCDSSNMKDVYYNPSETQQSLFDTYADNIKEDRTPEDLLFQVMLDLGVLLSSKIEETTIAGKQVFNVADGFLIACFDNDVTEETVKAVAEKKPYYAVFRDSSMANDSVATNFDQIFASISPDTVRKVL